MMPFCIQRCTLKTTDLSTITGIVDVLRPEYMGSAEFEFGALPTSLRHIATNWEHYASLTSGREDKTGRELVLLADRRVETDVRAAVRGLSREHVTPTKEWVGLEYALNGYEGQGYGGSRPTVWWDIEHHWLAVLGDDNAAAVMEGLRKQRERYIQQGTMIVPPLVVKKVRTKRSTKSGRT